jgi:hypothetical protein
MMNQLFSVTIPWNLNDPSEGIYNEVVAAEDAASAIKRTAESMAMQRESGCEDDEERRQYVENRVESPEQADVALISDRIAGDVKALFGISGDINIDALGAVLVRNRHLFSSPEKRTLPARVS